MYRLTVLAALLTLALSNLGLAGGSDAVTMLRARMEITKGTEPFREMRITDEQLKRADPNELLATLAPYAQDTNRSVRSSAYAWLARVATLHPTPVVRQQAVSQLVESVYDQKDGNGAEWLMQFTAEDFNTGAKDVIRQATSKERIGVLTVRLCGVANMQDQLPRLEALLIDEVAFVNDPNVRVSSAAGYEDWDPHAKELQVQLERRFPSKWYHTVGWEARLARARMGVKEDIAKCIELAEREENKAERVLTILPQIGYIRQPEGIQYLRTYLESDERLPRLGAIRLSYASRVMNILAESLEDYPIKPKPSFNYTDEEIELCRKWMADETNWKIIR